MDCIGKVNSCIPARIYFAEYGKLPQERGDSGLKQELKRNDVFSLRTFLALGFGKLDLLTFFKRAMTFTDNGAKMNKQVFTTLTFDKTITLCTVEPFDGSSLSF